MQLRGGHSSAEVGGKRKGLEGKGGHSSPELGDKRKGLQGRGGQQSRDMEGFARGPELETHVKDCKREEVTTTWPSSTSLLEHLQTPANHCNTSEVVQKVGFRGCSVYIYIYTYTICRKYIYIYMCVCV